MSGKAVGKLRKDSEFGSLRRIAESIAPKLSSHLLSEGWVILQARSETRSPNSNNVVDDALDNTTRQPCCCLAVAAICEEARCHHH